MSLPEDWVHGGIICRYVIDYPIEVFQVVCKHGSFHREKDPGRFLFRSRKHFFTDLVVKMAIRTHIPSSMLETSASEIKLNESYEIRSRSPQHPDIEELELEGETKPQRGSKSSQTKLSGSQKRKKEEKPPSKQESLVRAMILTDSMEIEPEGYGASQKSQSSQTSGTFHDIHLESQQIDAQSPESESKDTSFNDSQEI